MNICLCVENCPGKHCCDFGNTIVGILVLSTNHEGPKYLLAMGKGEYCLDVKTCNNFACALVVHDDKKRSRSLKVIATDPDKMAFVVKSLPLVGNVFHLVFPGFHYTSPFFYNVPVY